MRRRLATLSAALVLFAAAPALAQPLGVTWTPYTDDLYGFSAELPLGLFAPVEAEGSPGVVLAEVGGDARLSFYGGPATGLSRDELEARLASGEEISEVTYRTGGDSWFVLSGYYQPTTAGDSTIFYTKVMFSPDQQTFSAFEISFPAEDKPRFEALVERLEDGFTRPR